MSTNAMIRVEGVKYAELYKHWDGYPDATLEWLVNFNEDFRINRGNDPSYKFAQLIRSSTKIDSSPYTGWGVYEFGAVASQQFEYFLRDDGSVEVLDVYAGTTTIHKMEAKGA